MSSLTQSLVIVIPILFVLTLGFLAERTHAFGAQTRPIPIINEMVLNFALPASLFVGTVKVSKTGLEKEFVLFVALLLTLLIGYGIGFAVAKLIFKQNVIASAIAALGVSFSAGPFFGPAVLGKIYGAEKSGVAISLISLVLNVVIIPLTTTVIKIELQRKTTQHISVGKLVGNSVFQAIFKTPYVWAPLLGIILVFLDFKIPVVASASLNLIGETTTGVAVFVAGMTIANNKFQINSVTLILTILKNVGLPILFLGVAFLLRIVPGSMFFNQGLLLAALPTGPMMVLLATRYKEFQKEASSILVLSTIGMLITVTGLILILHI
ncbi:MULTISPECIES: AEC family transporter [Lactobacillaceae]|uniref:Transport protein n=1 Tax=Lentilactobacillus farraginis DSM 18382 = JCM 14108 TaxID=1423743 RepID=X0PC22_9LACO|nr:MULTISPECIES: AEC family transporter [Lactobacillaceae]KRM09401.1 hypothetical protein FD41_GL002609 [Lentilactobacillus farraginis DSM 18382 = JCM 14108]MCP9306102.1 AEC family transporter [Lacticaseibacillus paracasei]MCP9311565.1 AEC family transporter [Lacticaseibacillus paracasei]MCP9348273.1 AEC family transporter [Lacticaseibacillus paracasei]MCP9367828.1 AEC family transporter [Lacticaseibacillus paracasei]